MARYSDTIDRLMEELGKLPGRKPLFADLPDDEAVWSQLEGRRRRLKIMDRFCTGCGACVATCASQALHLENNKAALDEAACVLCGYCAAVCPQFLIRVV